jgi:ATP-dependent DNA ligase
MKIQIFNPIESVNPIYLGGADMDLYKRIISEHKGKTFAEIKEDGYRMQIHKKGDEIRAFTRSMNPYFLDLMPELASSLKTLPDCILDCELIGDGKIGHEGYDFVKKRFRAKISDKKRKEYFSCDLIQDNPLSIKVFDTLFWENSVLLDMPLEQRRNYTQKIDAKRIQPSIKQEVTNDLELQRLFENLISKNYEGLVCKNPSSIYVPGAKDINWIKLKRAESLDLLVLGVYNQGNSISQVLCGTFNPQKNVYETLAKVNAKRNHANIEIQTLLNGKYLKKCPSNIYLNPSIFKANLAYPDYFIQPQKSIVLEIAAMNFNRGKNWHSCGLDDGGLSYSLRIAWLKNIRLDKVFSKIADVAQIKSLYEAERS